MPANPLLLQVEINFDTLTCDVSEITLNDFISHALTDSGQLLSQIWENLPPARRHIHVFVQMNGGDGAGAGDRTPSSLQRASCFPLLTPPSVRLASVSAAQAALAPSSVTASVTKYKEEQQVHPIFNGRPLERRGPPVVIYNESLAKLKHELHNIANSPEPPASHIASTAELFQVAAEIHKTEDQREKEIYDYLERLVGQPLDRSVRSFGKSSKLATKVDATVVQNIQHPSFGKKAVVAYVELKNELGMCGDGGLQGALSFRKFVAGEDVKL